MWINKDTIKELLRLSEIISEIDQIKSDQEGMSEILRNLSERVIKLEHLMETSREVLEEREKRMSAEIREASIDKVQNTINAVQGQFHSQLQDLLLRLDRIEQERGIQQFDGQDAGNRLG